MLEWLQSVWDMVDERLRETSAKLQRLVTLLRVVVLLLGLGILAVLGSAVIGLFWPRWFFVAYAVASVFLVVPLAALLVLAMAPLRMRSVVRLIEKGYPANARELAIRLAARKLRDQSIETEELLVETALNEGRKVLERAKARAAAQAAADAAAAAPPPVDVSFGKPGEPPSSPPPGQP